MEGKHNKKLSYETTNSWDELKLKSRLRLELLRDKTRDFLGLNSNIVFWDDTIIYPFRVERCH